MRLQASNARKLSGEFRYRWGDFWTGTVKEYEGSVEWRPAPFFFGALNYQVVDAQLPQGAFDFALNYAQEREAFDQKLIEHQTIGNYLAEMATRIDAARLLTYRAAWLKGQGVVHTTESSMAKLLAARVAVGDNSAAPASHSTTSRSTLRTAL